MIRKVIGKTQQLIYDLNDNFHIIGFPLLVGWSILHRIKFILGKKIAEFKGQLMRVEKSIDSNKIYWINPILIQDFSKVEFNKISEKILVKKGNWDRNKKTIKNLSIYKSFSQRIEDKKKWEEIGFYQEVLTQNSIGKEKWGCKTEDEFNDKIKHLDVLIDQVNIHGIPSKKELLLFMEKLAQLNIPIFSEEIIVNIDRNGRFLVTSGLEILVLLKVLKASIVPIKIKLRHKKWNNFKKELWYFSRNGGLYQKPTHPDLQDLPYRYGELRFSIIKENLTLSKGNVLDIGANLGYFSRKFEDLGFNCYAIEGNWLYAYFLKKLRRAENKKFKLIRHTILKINKDKKLKYDIILALNIFHHFLKRKNTYLNLRKFLKRLEVKEFFFEAHNPQEFQVLKTYRNFNPDEFINFLLRNSNLTKVKFLATVKPGRNLYKLTP